MERLFPNLPDELGIQCLLWVPLKSHPNLRKVCKSWKAVMSSTEFYQERKRCLLRVSLKSHPNLRKACKRWEADPKICEEYLFLVTKINHAIFPNGFELSVYQYDPVNNKWGIRLSSIAAGNGKVGLPPPVNQKLIMIGRSDYSMTVIVYDSLSGNWNSKVVKPPKDRFRCACSASPEGLIYIAGGGLSVPGRGFDRGAAVYNVEKNKWEALPDMNSPMHYSQGAFSDGKFYVNSICDSDWHSRRHVEVFDTKTHLWTTLHGADPWFSRCIVSAFGTLYSFKTQGVMEYDCNYDLWRLVEPLPRSVAEFHCGTVWRGKIFLAGVARKRRGKGHCCTQIHVFYMYTPRNWIAVDSPPNFCYSLHSTGTLSIGTQK